MPDTDVFFKFTRSCCRSHELCLHFYKELCLRGSRRILPRPLAPTLDRQNPSAKAVWGITRICPRRLNFIAVAPNAEILIFRLWVWGGFRQLLGDVGTTLNCLWDDFWPTFDQLLTNTVRHGPAWLGLAWLIEVRVLAYRSEGSGQ